MATLRQLLLNVRPIMGKAVVAQQGPWIKLVSWIILDQADQSGEKPFHPEVFHTCPFPAGQLTVFANQFVAIHR